MPKVTTENLSAIAAEAQQKYAAYKSILLVCAGNGCVSSGSLSLYEVMQKEIDKRDLGSEIKVVATGCNGFCSRGPICVVQPDGIFYQKLKARHVPELIEQHFVQGQPVENLMYRAAKGERVIPLEKDIQFFAKQQCIALRNRGQLDPESIADAIRRGAYLGLQKVLDLISRCLAQGIHAVVITDDLAADQPHRLHIGEEEGFVDFWAELS